jgi:hypothetical protein
LSQARGVDVPQKDLYHDAVRNALIKDGWTITHDPLYLPLGRRKVIIDLAADAPLGAEKEGRKIAVEIKSFVGASTITDLERAFGQMFIYTSVLEEEEPERLLYLALTDKTYANVFDETAMLRLLTRAQARLLLFDAEQEVITEWIETT